MNAATILCVDDEPNILQSLKRLLRREPYTLLTANTPDEALQLMSRHHVSVIISDQRMPAMSGTELLARVKSLYPDSIRIVLSGYADLATVAEAVNKGQIYRFLAKPWDDEDLKLTIRQCLEQYELAAQNRRLAEQIAAQNTELMRVNQQLSNAVSERTQLLDLSREMLANLPEAAIGISQEGIVAFTNAALRGSVPALRTVAPGDDAGAVLPRTVAERVEVCLRNRQPTGEWTEHIDGQPVRMRLRALLGQANAAGCLLLIQPPGEVLRQVVEAEAANESVLDRTVGEDLGRAIGAIRPLPAAAQRLCQMAGEADVDMREMEIIIAADAALTARILSVANSSFYGLSHRVATVAHAASILGLHSVRNMALAAAVIGFGRHGSTCLDMTAFWRHCAAVAIISHRLAALLKLRNADSAFVGGLLHDIGRAVLASVGDSFYGTVVERVRQQGVPMQVAERELLGTDSTEVGRRLCEHWQLPEDLTAIVAHINVDAGARGAPDQRLAAVVESADTLATLMGLGDSGNPRITPSSLAVLRQFGVDAVKLRALLAEIPAAVQELERLFELTGAGVGQPQPARCTVAVDVQDAAMGELIAIVLLSFGCTVGEHVAGAEVLVTDYSRSVDDLTGVRVVDCRDWTNIAGMAGDGSLDATRLRNRLLTAVAPQSISTGVS